MTSCGPARGLSLRGSNHTTHAYYHISHALTPNEFIALDQRGNKCRSSIEPRLTESIFRSQFFGPNFQTDHHIDDQSHHLANAKL